MSVLVNVGLRACVSASGFGTPRSSSTSRAADKLTTQHTETRIRTFHVGRPVEDCGDNLGAADPSEPDRSYKVELAARNADQP